MKFDFDEMSRLYREAPEVFEQRRIELINYAIDRCTGPQREALKKLQYELDQIRKLRPETFALECMQEATHNLSVLLKHWVGISKEINKMTTLIANHD